MRTVKKVSGFFTGLVGLFTVTVISFKWILVAMLEAIIFQYAFNYVAPLMIAWGVTMPVLHISWTFTVCILILIQYGTSWIRKLYPNK